MRALRSTAVLAALLAAAAASAGDRGTGLLVLLTDTGIIDASDRSRVAAGRGVLVVLPVRGPNLAVFGIARTTADGPRLAAWTGQPEVLYRGRYISSIGRFSATPGLDDLAGLTLDDEELSDLRKCRPGDCGLKLSAGEMRQILDGMTGAGSAWRPAVQLAFRRVLLERTRAYVRGGLRGALPYEDRKSPARPDAEFEEIAALTDVAALGRPDAIQYLQAYPDGNTEGVDSFLYWSKEMLGSGKPIVSITHVGILRDPPPGDGAVVVGRQVYASHYLTGSLSLMRIASDGDGTPTYIAYSRRVRVDAFEGAFGSIVRRMVTGRIRSEAPQVFEGFRRKLETGAPPAAGSAR